MIWKLNETISATRQPIDERKTYFFGGCAQLHRGTFEWSNQGSGDLIRGLRMFRSLQLRANAWFRPRTGKHHSTAGCLLQIILRNEIIPCRRHYSFRYAVDIVGNTVQVNEGKKKIHELHGRIATSSILFTFLRLMAQNNDFICISCSLFALRPGFWLSRHSRSVHST